MKNRRSAVVIGLGICLLLLGVSLTAFFRIQMNLGARQSQSVAADLEEILPDRTTGAVGLYPSAGMPVLSLQSRDYVALLDIPAFGLTLPVADQWDSAQLSRSPARFFGNAYDGSLIIGGADHPQQFAFCGEIEHGMIVTVTDMTGAQFTYTVTRVDRAKHADPKWLAKSEYDLTLFCHDVFAMEYIAVRCVLTGR